MLRVSLHAAPLPSQTPQGPECVIHEIHKITLPVYSDRPQSPHFQYSFQVQPGSDPSLPMIIYLPGGPGETSIGRSLSKIPKTFTVIHTDPRGAGCNTASEQEIPDNALTSEYLAADILGIVQELQLKDYLIFGVSYGSVVATLAAKVAEDARLPPRSIILEGTVGRAFHGTEILQGYIDQWRMARSQLSRIARSEINSRVPPLKRDGLDWGAWIQGQLLLGVDPANGNPLVNSLEYLAPGVNFGSGFEQLLALSVYGASSIKKIPSSQIRVHRQIACREITDSMAGYQSDFTLVRGELVPLPLDYCSDIKLTRPYDSARTRVSVPIFYFAGENDPATPVGQAKYHFENQTAARRFFVKVPRGGHDALGANLSDCIDWIWRGIIDDGASLSAALAKCKLRPTLEVR